MGLETTNKSDLEMQFSIYQPVGIWSHGLTHFLEFAQENYIQLVR